MAEILIRDATFRYPVYDVMGRSLKVSLSRQLTGGELGSRSGVVTVEALKRISMHIKDGDRVGLIGHNGAGKSTFLRLVAGLAIPQEGGITVEGRMVPLIEKGVGINPDLSGMENIELPLRLMGASSAEVRQAKASIPDFTGLGPFINMPVRTYSDGMRTRLSFAICTALEADILVLDEWLSAGDIDFQETANARLKECIDRTKILVIATHSTELVRNVCNVAVLLSGGSVVMMGDPPTVIDAYTSLASKGPRLVAKA
jgi:ABC-type polysaccharide/polyol phosphate transport system ATPase subunit